MQQSCVGHGTTRLCNGEKVGKAPFLEMECVEGKGLGTMAVLYGRGAW